MAHQFAASASSSFSGRADAFVATTLPALSSSLEIGALNLPPAVLRMIPRLGARFRFNPIPS
jgi:hypothetical protein